MRNPYLYLLKTAWQYSGIHKKRYILIYFLFIVSILLSGLYPILFGWFVNKAQRDTQHILHFSILYACSYLGLKLLEWSFHGPARILEQKLAFEISQNFLQERYHQVLHLSAKWHQDHHSGATINRIRKGYEGLREFYEHGFQYIYVIGEFMMSVTAMLYFSPLFGGFALLIGVFNIFVIRAFDRPFVKALEEGNEKEHFVSSTLFDSLSNIMTVITLRLEKSMEIGLMHKVKQVFKPRLKGAILNEWKWFWSELLIALIYGVITLGYIYEHWEAGKAFYLGGLVTLLGYVSQFSSVFQNIAWQYTDIVQFSASIKAANSIVEDFQSEHRPDIATGLPAEWKKIQISNLNFSYPMVEGSFQKRSNIPKPNLSNLNITLHRGKRIALIGESGSGKSTLLSLLRGLYLPEKEVEIKIDDHEFTFARLNESITLFPQEPEIFENTILYNITLGLPYSSIQIEKACQAAYFNEVIEDLPKGLDSDIREKGVNLSGGQKQRLALVRGILAAEDSDLILFDEPTSSVDPKTESMIYEGLFKAFSDKAIISSLHRLYLLNQFDYIYILQKGEIMEEGTFENLRDHSALFQDLWKHQEN